MQETENSSVLLYQGDKYGEPNATNSTQMDKLFTKSVLIVIPLGLLDLFAVIGNILVIYAITSEKSLQRLSNKLILSLAIVDLLTAILDMPVSIYQEVYNYAWVLEPELCIAWLTTSNFFCVSSNFHLLAIAIERYWAVTNVAYAVNGQPIRIYLLIGSAWIASAVVCVAYVLGWQDENFYERVPKELICYSSLDIAYVMFQTCVIFCIPLIIILVLYWNIFKEAKKRIRGNVSTGLKKRQSRGNESGQNTLPSEGEVSENQDGVSNVSVLKDLKRKSLEESILVKRVRKAAKVLMIITGAFIFCWLPFIAVYVLMTTCPSFNIDPLAYSILLWLSYVNSLINPVIYTVFSPDFRKAFRRIFCGVKFASPRTTIIEN